jgi:hypothetical protein
MLLSCLEIKGIPQREGENTDSLVKHLTNELVVDVKDEDIYISHRLPTSYSKRQNQDPMIIVKFTSRNIKDRFYQSRKGLRGKSTRDLGLSKVAENPIFISGSLTKQNKILFNKSLETNDELHLYNELHLYSAFFIWICSSALLTVVDKYTNYKC